MEDEIEERIQEKFNKKDIKILVEYESIRNYKITIICRHLLIETGIINKTIIFTYNWFNNFTFDANIQQLYYEIKTLLIKEEVWKYINRNDIT